MLCLTSSAAFDTLDQSILLELFEVTLRVSGITLMWFASYVRYRCQLMVTQGSVLEPVLFTLYAQSLSDSISAHNNSDNENGILILRLPYGPRR